MYERSFASEYFAQNPTAKRGPSLDELYVSQRDLIAKAQSRASLIRRSVSGVAIIMPAALGWVGNHPLLGLGVSGVALGIVGLVAFGLNVLDSTIELY